LFEANAPRTPGIIAMPVTKSFEETLRVPGACTDWLEQCALALEQGAFSRLRLDDESFIIDADYKGFTIDGSIRLLLTQEGDQAVIDICIIAAVDNVWALRDPLQRILRAFKQHLLPA
jgi:hypothetical protein